MGLDELATNRTLNMWLRTAAAILVLAGGLIHLKLYNDGHTDAWPNDNLGRQFLLNVGGSVAVAVALAVWRHWIPVVAGLGVVNGTMLAFGISRTSSGVPFTRVEGVGSFQEIGWTPSPEAALALVAEIGAAAALLLLLPSALATRSQPEPEGQPLVSPLRPPAAPPPS